MRVGITTGKKTGGAVARARARRIIRAAAAQVLPQGAGSFDIVFVARAATPTQKSTALIPVIKKHLEKAGVLQNDR